MACKNCGHNKIEHENQLDYGRNSGHCSNREPSTGNSYKPCQCDMYSSPRD